VNIAVVGLGKLGTPLAAWVNTRHQVVGIDIDPETVAAINEGQSPVQETGMDALINFDASADYARAADAEIVFVVVPTPSLSDGAFSLEYVQATVDGLRPYLTPAHLLVVVSTVMPGHMDELAEGLDCGLCYNPFFIALGSVLHDMQEPDLVLIGQRLPRDGLRLVQFWRSMGVQAPTFTLGFRSAEVAKLALNCFVTMKISFANTLGEMCEELGADGQAVAGAIGHDRRVGRHYLKPATAYGGPCFPRDNRAFIGAAGAVGVDPSLARATDRVNRWQHRRLRNKVLLALDELKLGRPGVVAVLGLAYKVGTPICEESPGLALADLLREMLVEVRAHDPMAGGDAQYCVHEADVVVITTPWPEYKNLNYGGRIVIDPWGVTK